MMRLLKKAYKCCFRLARFLPVNKRLIIFESYHGNQYSCNPRAIYEYLMDNHPEDYEMYWSVNKKHNKKFIGLNIPYVNRFSLRWLFLLSRARYWVINTRMPLWIKKPRHTIFLQTWHGTPLKKLALDIEEVHMPGTDTEKYKQNFLKESRNWDYLISPNQYSTKIFKSAFDFQKKILETGYPRNDYLMKEYPQKTVTKLKETLGIPKHKKVILYAPTWRDDEYYEKGKYKFELKLNLEKLYKELGNEYVIVLRMHYLVVDSFQLPQYKGFIYDLSEYEDIRELYLISDILITDYSSVFFDYLCLLRPVIFFTYDLEKYRDKLRGFYFDFENEAPGPLVKNTDELLKIIRQLNLSKFKPSDSYLQLHQKICDLEGNESTKKVVNEVFLKGH